MSNYIVDRLDWYADRLKAENFSIIRNSESSGIYTYYMISEQDWRHSVIFSSSAKNTFRIDFLYVNIDNSYTFSENQFDDMIKMIKSDLSNL